MWNAIAIQSCLLCFESSKFIEKFKNLGISGIGIVTAYFMFCNDKNSVKIFGRFLAKSITITKDVFAISSVIESLTNMNFDNFVADLLTAVIENAFSKEEKSVEEKLEYFHFIVEKIFFRHNHSTINKKPLRSFETVDINSFILLLTTVRDRVSFNYGYSISEEGKWVDEDLAVELLHQGWLSFSTNCLNMIDYMCLMSFVMKRNINKNKKFLFDENYKIIRAI
ncbi:hypothetical protein TVAG_031070 [Trichomonas vaginalis G3]|uniref:Uncharacterized protein n=1 Tax=Trichomonas vaginalis (strain ATCC PRA-98 / G3) TaxID=412133 RepID=A2HKX9_TRIV3|nr:hypothetical protein TVAG_031070 [Trichomonas vaginalis G3]|eukprot:XP_001282868.1 hypothetical protein [Trichomonas vaginalis G3]